MKKIKVNDDVIVLAGKDKGKTGRILKVLKNDKVVVEAVNMIKKHQKPVNGMEHGTILEVEAPIHISNVKKIENNKAPKKEEKTEKAKKTVKKTTAKKTVAKATKKKD